MALPNIACRSNIISGMCCARPPQVEFKLAKWCALPLPQTVDQNITDFCSKFGAKLYLSWELKLDPSGTLVGQKFEPKLDLSLDLKLDPSWDLNRT